MKKVLPRPKRGNKPAHSLEPPLHHNDAANYEQR